MKKIKNISISVTVADTIFFLIMILGMLYGFILYKNLSYYMVDTYEGIQNIEPDYISGYLLLGGLFGLGVESIFTLVFLLLAVICGIGAILFLIPALVGYINLYRIRHQSIEYQPWRFMKIMKFDAIIKIIFHGLISILLIAMIWEGFITIVFVGVIAVLVLLGLSIWQCVLVSQKEETDFVL